MPTAEAIVIGGSEVAMGEASERRHEAMQWRRLLLGWVRWAGDGDVEMERTGGGGLGVAAPPAL